MRPRVLIADDHPEVVKAICRLLALNCDIVGTVADGPDVIEAARRLQPDVIIVDLNLPTMSGLDACRQLTQENPAAKVIIFTAADDPGIQRRAFALGAAACVSKVSSDCDLLTAVKSLCDLP